MTDNHSADPSKQEQAAEEALALVTGSADPDEQVKRSDTLLGFGLGWKAHAQRAEQVQLCEGENPFPKYPRT